MFTEKEKKILKLNSITAKLYALKGMAREVESLPVSPKGLYDGLEKVINEFTDLKKQIAPELYGSEE